MIKFSYSKDNITNEENFLSNNGWDFEVNTAYNEILSILEKDVERLTDVILENYQNINSLEKSLSEFLDCAKKDKRFANIWQSDSNLVLSVGSYDPCHDKLDNSLVIKDNWRDFFFFSRNEVDGITKLERFFVSKKDNIIYRENYENLGEFNYSDDKSVNSSIKKMILNYDNKDGM